MLKVSSTQREQWEQRDQRITEIFFVFFVVFALFVNYLGFSKAPIGISSFWFGHSDFPFAFLRLFAFNHCDHGVAPRCHMR